LMVAVQLMEQFVVGEPWLDFKGSEGHSSCCWVCQCASCRLRLDMDAGTATTVFGLG
jgi:hypothetical protein